MKPILGITFGLFLAVFAAPTGAVVPMHSWSRSAGGMLLDVGSSVAVDGSGNVVVTGNFQNTVDFGGVPLASAGGTDIYLAKYDFDGVHQWSKRFGSTGADAGFSVKMDWSGNVVVAGSFRGTVDFGGGPLVSASGSTDIFMAKYDASGAHVWSKHFGDTLPDQILCIALDGSGNVVVTGIFAGTVDFGGGPLVSVAGITDIFVAKYDASGVHQWSKSFGDAENDAGRAVAVDDFGNVLVTGVFAGSVDFGGGPLASAGGDDIFVAKYDAGGAHQWSRSFGDVNNDQGTSVAVDGSGNVVVTGSFQATVDFGGGPHVSAGGQDIFVAKYNALGSLVWSESFGDTGFDLGRSVALDASGNVVVAGLFNGTVDFGGGGLVNAGSGDVFMAMYDASGAHQWSRSFGSTGTDSGAGVAVDGSENVIMTGTFQGSVSFGGDLFVSAGNGDIFIAKYREENPIPVLISRFDAALRRGGVELKWELWSDEVLASFTLFRGRGESSPVVIAAGSARVTGSYTDASVEAGETYQYELVIRTVGGDEFRSPMATVTMPRATVALAQNFPNPFNPQTTIEYTVSAQARVSIEIFDASGARVRVLDESVREAGSYRAEWDGRDAVGRLVGSGVYFYRLAGVKGAETRKMVLLK